MAVSIQLKRGTALEWTAANPVLLEGEMGLELDTHRYKFGDGLAAWGNLPYASADSLPLPLVEWARTWYAYASALTYANSGVVSSATLGFPDGSAGQYTGTNYDATAEVYLGYTVSHADSGLTATQPPVTLDANGNVITIPPIEITGG